MRPDQLANIFVELYGPDGLVVDSTASLAGGQSHSAHFNGSFESEFSQFGIALTSQLVSLPQPAPAAGFTYQFDPALGVFTRTTNSFGPILSERAETIGRQRLSLGFATQRLSFDSIEGLDLKRIPAVFTHDNAQLRGGREDVISTLNAIDATVTRSTAFLSYGVTNRLDVSVAIPVVDINLLVTSNATVRRIGTLVPEIHFFRQTDDSVGDHRTFTAFGDATGLGDINMRAKTTIKRTPHARVRGGHRRATAHRRRDGSAGHRRGRRPALRGLVGIGRAAFPTPQRGVPVERVQSPGRRAQGGAVRGPPRRRHLQRRRRARGPSPGHSGGGRPRPLRVDSSRLVGKTFQALDGKTQLADIGFRQGHAQRT